MYLFVSIINMASRTNKRGIAAKKAQQQKQAKKIRGERRFTYPKRKVDLNDAKEQGFIGVVTNAKGHDYHRFLKGRKTCRETWLRVDPDGYRYIKTPSGGSEVVEVGMSGWVRKRIIKSKGRMM